MYYGGEYNVPGAPGNLIAGNPFGPQFAIPGRRPVGQPVLPGEDKKAIEEVYGTPGPKPMPGAAPLGLPMAFGSSNLPGAVGNMAGIANAQFFEGPQLGQAAPQGEPGKPYGGAPNVPLTPEEKARLLQQGSPIPPNFREQYLPKADVPAGFQNKFVS